MSRQLRQDITKYNLLLWQLRGATGGGQTDFVLQDKSDFFSLAQIYSPPLAIKCVKFTFFGT